MDSYDALNNLTQLAALISEVTGEAQAQVMHRLELERRYPLHSVTRDFQRHAGGPPHVWGPHMERFYGSTDAFLYELAIWNRSRLKRSMRRFAGRDLERV